MKKHTLPMYPNKTVLLGWLVFCFGVNVWGQTGSIFGTIKDQNSQKPIVGAYVMLCQRTDSSIVFFTTTDAQGNYRLKKPAASQNHFLKITCVGYADTLLALQPQNEPNQINEEVSVLLSEKAFDLKEVKITALIPIKERGDTTIYKIDAFAKNQEQTLEELLKRLPNVRVEQNGDVYFKNKKIEKVFIEGDNLSGDKYQTLTRSIDPALLDEVQAIENFSENPILKTFGGQKETVLNLTIKKERKRLLFGSTDARASLQRADVAATLISYLKGTKQLLLGSGNNVGKERVGDITPSTSLDPSWSGLSVAGQPLHTSNNLFSRLLNIPLERFNNERVLQYNLASPMGKTLKVNSGFTLLKDQNQAFPRRETRFLSDNPFVFSQIDSAHQTRQMQKAHLQFHLIPNSKTNVVLQGHWHSWDKDLAQQTLFLQQNSAQNISQNFQAQQQMLLLKAELTRHINPKNALVLDLNTSRAQINDHFMTNVVVPTLAQNIFGEVNSFDNFRQDLHQQRSTNTAQLKWFYADSTYKSQTWVGVAQQFLDFNLSSLAKSATKDSLFSNLTLLNMAHEGMFRVSKIEFTYRLMGSYLTNHINTQPAKRWFLQPSITLNYATNGRHFLILNVARKVNYLEGLNLLNATLLNDFRTAQMGNATLMLNPSTLTSLSYLYNDPIKRKMTVLGTLFWNKNQQLWGFNDNIFLLEYSLVRTGQVFGLDSYGLNLNMEKLIYGIRGNVKTEVASIWSEGQNLLNDRNRNTVSHLVALKGSYLSAFDFPLNVEFMSSHTLNFLRISDQNAPQQTTQMFATSRQSATLFAKIKFLSWRFEANRNAINQNTFWVFNSSFAYALNKKLQLSLDGQNLFDTQQFSYFQLTPLNSFAATYPVLSRFVMIGLKYNF
ncbi:MAG: carboxypeptidase-like regulatory domain-containing protein [Runella sp.]